MKTPPTADEAARLEALRAYHILDTGAEQIYDDVTMLVCHICQVPIATISLVDKDRQWFKSKIGINQNETPRDVSFCTHAILQSEPLIVTDALADARFLENPLVTGEPGMRFYAGFPLVTREGFALGTVCAIDHVPHLLNAEQKLAMIALARQVMVMLELRRVSDQLAQSLEHVKTLQALLPICAWCKRIRDDEGYWNQVESYLHDNTGTEFTHGICPECLKKVSDQRSTAA